MSHFVEPLWKLVSSQIPELEPCYSTLQHNLTRWRVVAEEGEEAALPEVAPHPFEAAKLEGSHSMARIERDLAVLPLLPSECA